MSTFEFSFVKIISDVQLGVLQTKVTGQFARSMHLPEAHAFFVRTQHFRNKSSSLFSCTLYFYTTAKLMGSSINSQVTLLPETLLKYNCQRRSVERLNLIGLGNNLYSFYSSSIFNILHSCVDVAANSLASQ